jgi:HIRAN domain
MSDQFSRRQINSALIALALVVRAPTRLNATRTVLFDFAIAGGFYHGLHTALAELKPGEQFQLRAEPDNPHDANAVAVLRNDGLVLGYIPREANTPIARLLTEGASVECEMVGTLNFSREADILDDFICTGFSSGDPRLRLVLLG